ncbi:MAG: hypothetical protein ACKV2O_24870 [Acidimicrobiales bacterium]
MTTYKAICSPEGDDWNIHIAEVDHVFTWAPNLRKAAQYAQEAVALHLEVPLEEVEIEIMIADAEEELEAARSQRAAAEVTAAAAAEATRRAVAKLAELGLSDRDAALALGLSFQRVHQIRSVLATGS